MSTIKTKNVEFPKHEYSRLLEEIQRLGEEGWHFCQAISATVTTDRFGSIPPKEVYIAIFQREISDLPTITDPPHDAIDQISEHGG